MLGGEGPALDGRWALLCFLKAPRPGRVKNRLAGHIGEQAATTLYTKFVEETVALALRTRPLLTPVGVVSPDDALPEIRSLLDERLPLWPQGEGSLGDRMLGAARRAFRGGAERVIIMGSDAPDLPLSYLLSAAQRLDRHDLLLGPAIDGGYYLVAMKRPVEAIFTGISWSTAHVLQQTTARARAAGMTTGFLPRWRDVDEPEDLKDLAERLSLRGQQDALLRAVEEAVRLLPSGSRLDGTTGPTQD